MTRRFVHMHTRTTAVLTDVRRNDIGKWECTATWYRTDGPQSITAEFNTKQAADEHYARATPAVYQFQGGEHLHDWRETNRPTRTRRPRLETGSGIASADTLPTPEPPSFAGMRLQSTSTGPFAILEYDGHYPPDLSIGAELPATPEILNEMQRLGLGRNTSGLRIINVEVRHAENSLSKRYTFMISIPPRLLDAKDADAQNAAIRYQRAIYGQATDGKAKRQISFDD